MEIVSTIHKHDTTKTSHPKRKALKFTNFVKKGKPLSKSAIF